MRPRPKRWGIPHEDTLLHCITIVVASYFFPAVVIVVHVHSDESNCPAVVIECLQACPQKIPWHAQEAPSLDVKASIGEHDSKAEDRQESKPEGVAEVHKATYAPEELVDSGSAGPADSDAEDDEPTGSPTSTCSWHGTPTWSDMTTFSQVGAPSCCQLQQALLSSS